MNGILPKIEGPKGVKALNREELPQLCDELREKIICTVAQNGGHLASNLGVVELTVALFSVFDFPGDTVVWDVGHQCYAHKLLSGRFSKFNTVRTEDGLSGFPSRDESDCDPFTTGHSSTSISSALGISVAEQLLGENHYTIAVIGDGSLTGGLAFEGLNNAGRRKKNFIVILNDNNMSISRNVGSMARSLGHMRSRPGYIRAKIGVERVLGRIPKVGHRLAAGVRGAKNLIKRGFYNSNLFEDMGFAYYGPYDGHDLSSLTEILETAKQVKKPVVIHVRTTKGKGYDHAETNPKDFHGVSGFDAFSGKLEPGKRNFSSVFGSCISNMAMGNKRICAITAAMALGTGLYGFSHSYKDRFFDVGIAEGHGVTFAAGLARKGMLPVFAVYSTFLQRAYDNLLHDVALQKLKVILAVDRAGAVGEDGKTHQGFFDVSLFKTIPGTTVYSPAYFDELDFTLQKVVEDESLQLTVIRYPRGHEGYRPPCFVSNFGDYDVFGDEQAQLCIVTYGRIFSQAALAAEKLQMPVKIIKLNRILPIPQGAVEEAAKSQKLLFAEEAVAGIGESFCLKLYSQGFTGKLRLCDVQDGFVTHADMDKQLAMLGLDDQGIADSVKRYF